MKVSKRINFRVEYSGSISLPFASDGLAALACRRTVAGSITARALGDIGFATFPDEQCSDPAGAYLNRCQDIVLELRREFGDDIKTRILWDESATCSYCRCVWEECPADGSYADMYVEPGDGPGLPVCCGPAQDEWRAVQAEVTA
jgi:hypothetical protein